MAGTKNKPGPKAGDPVARFLSYVSPEPTSGCWLWTGFTTDGGYGRFYVSRSEGKDEAHRYSFKVFRGIIPSGLDLDHLCRVRCCVNPWHLEAVTRKVNLNRGLGHIAGSTASAALQRALTHCPRGHEYTVENTHYPPAGGRRCRECDRMMQRLRFNNLRKGERKS